MRTPACSQPCVMLAALGEAGPSRCRAELMGDYQRYAASGRSSRSTMRQRGNRCRRAKSFAAEAVSTMIWTGVTVDLGSGSLVQPADLNTEPLLRLSVGRAPPREVEDPLPGIPGGSLLTSRGQQMIQPHLRRPRRAVTLLDADREGLLRASATAGAQGAPRQGAAVGRRTGNRSSAGSARRSVIWLARRGPAATARVLIGILGATRRTLVSQRVPPWIGLLDVLVVAGDDPADPALVSAVAVAVRRGSGRRRGPVRGRCGGRRGPPRCSHRGCIRRRTSG